MTPPRYLYHDGHGYVLAKHMAEQMERVMEIARAEMLKEIGLLPAPKRKLEKVT